MPDIAAIRHSVHCNIYRNYSNPLNIVFECLSQGHYARLV